MVKIISDVFMYIFEALLLYNYADGLFVSKNKTSVKVAGVAAANVILFLFYQLKFEFANGILLLGLYYLVFRFIFNVKTLTAIFHSFLCISAMLVSEMVILNLCSVIFNDFFAMHSDTSAYLFVITTSKILYFAVIMGIKKLCLNRKNGNNHDGFSGMLFMFPLVSLLVSVLVFYMGSEVEISDEAWVLVTLLFFVLLVADLIIFSVHENAVKNRNELYELKAAKFQQEIDEKYFIGIEQSQEEIRQFSHDMKNHLLQIRYLEDVEEIHRYLDEVISDVEKISYVGISSNKILNLIISKYSALCEKKRIKFIPEVKLANLKYVEDYDLSTLLNNLLDNAVESAEKSEEKLIELKIFSKNKNFDGIIIKNSCEKAPKHRNKELITTKKDKLLHGLGVSIVKKTLNKYDAMYDWQYIEESKTFETSIVLPKTSEK